MAHISDLLIRGGLNNVDDYRLYGGEPVAISGGDGQTTTYIAGNKPSIILRNKLLEWETFKEVHPDNSDTRALCNTANIILDGRQALELDDTLEILRATYRMSDMQLSRTLTRRLDFGEFTKRALKSIFNNWMKYIEKLVVEYINVRNKYIAKTGVADVPNDMAALKKNWKALDHYYGINSSAPVLLYSNFPERPYDLPWLRGEFVEDDVWDILPDEFHWAIAGVPATNKFHKALQDANFIYLGFCPKAPKQRLLRLFKFPIEELLLSIKALDPASKSANDITISDLARMINDTHASGNPLRLEPPSVRREPEPGGDDAVLVRWYIDQFVQIYMTMRPHFEQIEKYYTDLAKKLGQLSIKLEGM
jgi:hypothetical protein